MEKIQALFYCGWAGSLKLPVASGLKLAIAVWIPPTIVVRQ
jgi:hypothetical protein